MTNILISTLKHTYLYACSAGFELESEPKVPGLAENYVMVFKPVPLVYSKRPGQGWATIKK